VRFGVDAREPPPDGSSGGAEGERIAARECGEDFDCVMVAVLGPLMRPGTDCLVWRWELDCFECG
jgi:hypothetical protein